MAELNVGPLFPVAMSVTRFARLVVADEMEAAQALLTELADNDPLAVPRIAIVSLCVAAQALNVKPTDLATAYAPTAQASDEDIAAMGVAYVEFAELVEGNDPKAAYLWWFRHDNNQLLADLLVLLASQLAEAYEISTGHAFSAPCTDPRCPIHGAVNN